MPDDGDEASDNNQCTTDGCSAGSPTHVPVTTGTPCVGGAGAKVCSAAGKCVECVTGSDCASNVCVSNICVAAQCTDTVQNGAETDVDCGGGSCPPCGLGEKCGGDTDCVSLSCISAHCASSCTDGEKGGSETDVDCGGSCPDCASGKACSVNGDCQSNRCAGSVCIDALLISELQTRGSAGGSDEFIEIYNPNAHAVTFSSAWEIWARNASSTAGPCQALSKRLTGAGQVIPAHGHLLYTNNTPTTGYDGPVAGDASYTTGYGDSGQVVLLHGGTLVDSLCYYFSAATQSNLTCSTAPAMWFTCQGAGVSNSPHNDTTNGTSNSDVSLERKPGGALGNGQSTGDNAADFVSNATPNPQRTTSPSTP